LLAVAALAALFALPASAGCPHTACPTAAFNLASVSDQRSYGILIAAPESGCARVRFRVFGAADRFLGHTPPLRPGELAVVRLGRGFSAGEHRLTIASVGCAAPPAATRRVTLAKLSPDHGWRAVR
jgi:hypothetical protein